MITHLSVSTFHDRTFSLEPKTGEYKFNGLLGVLARLHAEQTGGHGQQYGDHPHAGQPDGPFTQAGGGSTLFLSASFFRLGQLLGHFQLPAALGFPFGGLSFAQGQAGLNVLALGFV